MKTCTVPNCSAKHYGKGLCKLHYTRAREGKHGLEPSPCKMCGASLQGKRSEQKFCNLSCKMKWYRRFGCYTEERMLVSRGTCSVCEKPVHANGMCRTHNMRVARYGDPQVNNTKRVAAVCGKCGCPTGKGKAKDLCANCYHNGYYYQNHTIERARRNARRTRVQIATPPWADLTAIHKFYIACPPGHEVDHVVPLKGRLISGLHVLENLQYLPIPANRRKSNRFDL